MEIHFMGQLHDSFEINARRNNQIPEIKICIGRQLKRASVRDKNDRAVVVKVTTDRERSSSQMAPHLATGLAFLRFIFAQEDDLTGRWNVTADNGIPCVMMNAKIDLTLSYIQADDSVADAPVITVPSDSTTEHSSCFEEVELSDISVNSQVLQLNFPNNEGWIVRFYFSQDPQLKIYTGDYALYQVTVTANYSSMPDVFTNQPKGHIHTYYSVIDFANPPEIADDEYTRVGKSLYCPDPQYFIINNDPHHGPSASIRFTNLQMQAYMTEEEFGRKDICADDQREMDVVPVIVSGIIGLLAIFTVFAYFAYRFRLPPDILDMIEPEFGEAHEKPHHLKGQHFGLEHHDNYGSISVREESDCTMLEDMLYEMLPVVGLAVILSGAFVLSVLWKAKGNLRLFVFFAVSDIVNGIAFVMCGLHGMFITRTGTGNELLHPSSCLARAPHLVLWAYTDIMESFCLLLFLLDRTLQIALPCRYAKISKMYLILKFGVIFFVMGSVGVIPTFYDTVTTNSAVEVPKLCRFEQVVQPYFLGLRLLIIQWFPVFGMLWIGVIFLVLRIRRSNDRWSYNWSEKIADTKQMITLAFLRCLFTAGAVRLVLFNVNLANNAREIVLMRDLLLRTAVAVLVGVLSPGVYMLISTQFAERVLTTFNAYGGNNTERKWQSANDPPLDHQSAHAESSQLHSMSGPRLELPVHMSLEQRAEIERSASFYCDTPPASDSKRPFPNTVNHGKK
ncbi:hypothetical protein PRIPAC_79689 [Pristionchus pacificus]|uniref:G_PROTEIN_RECEP_F1_2 domain-containing protein n=1 Tax=Pristionchus pacificus TaxID=54126 RepID=A0A2A6CNN9_PRIPA|nr:hypothetical protein PRIPAC_79689 [Pristionchus pacificus]|eukprot:PDM79673.1 hypothetical protein PRIPAC_32252 [Pristionchus pacificus]